MQVFLDFLWAFLIGGAWCLIGQLLLDLTKLTPARILVSFVILGVLLSGLGLYEPIVDFAGAGATVPLVGFGHLLAVGVKEAIMQSGAIGIITGGFTAAAAGLCSVLTVALIVSLIFKRGDKMGN